MKFHFRWGTKPRDQKQVTGNNCDVISGLEVSGKTDFSDIFLLCYKQHTFVPFLANLLAHSKKNDGNLFSAKLKVLKRRHNHSQSLLLVSRFCTPPEVKFHVFGTSKDGEGKSPSIFFLLYLSVHCGDFIEQIKKSVTSREQCQRHCCCCC